VALETGEVYMEVGQDLQPGLNILITPGRRHGVTIIKRSALLDNRISPFARGLLGILMSLPPGRRVSIQGLADMTGMGEKRIRHGLSELADHGYLYRRSVRGPGGRWRHVTGVTDEPDVLVSPNAGFPQGGQPPGGEPQGGQPQGGQPPGGEPQEGEPPGGQPPSGEPADKGLKTEHPNLKTTTPKPPPAAQAESRAGWALRVVVEEGLPREVPRPGRRVLRRECARLAADGWLPEALTQQLDKHDWTGAGAGAVVAWLRDLHTPAQPQRPVERPEWCGRCVESTRLLEDPESGVPRRCDRCHPSTRGTHDGD
jgi:hypothetical protein